MIGAKIVRLSFARQELGEMARQNQSYIFTLDGWRALAIIVVLVVHIVGYEFHRHRWLFALTRISANGVRFFFAISGFLNCSRLLEEQMAFGHISLKGFYIRRAFRILPAALAYLMFVTLLALLGYIAVDRREFWATLLFWRNYLPKGWIHRGSAGAPFITGLWRWKSIFTLSGRSCWSRRESEGHVWRP